MERVCASPKIGKGPNTITFMFLFPWQRVSFLQTAPMPLDLYSSRLYTSTALQAVVLMLLQSSQLTWVPQRSGKVGTSLRFSPTVTPSRLKSVAGVSAIMPTSIRARIAYLLLIATSTGSQIFTGCLEVVITTKFAGVITASYRSASKWTLTATSNLRPSSRKSRRAWRSPTSKCPGPAH